MIFVFVINKRRLNFDIDSTRTHNFQKLNPSRHQHKSNLASILLLVARPPPWSQHLLTTVQWYLLWSVDVEGFISNVKADGQDGSFFSGLWEAMCHIKQQHVATGWVIFHRQQDHLKDLQGRIRLESNKEILHWEKKKKPWLSTLPQGGLGKKRVLKLLHVVNCC